VMALGTLLAAFPGTRRRRPTDPVSALITAAAEAPGGAGVPDRELTSVSGSSPRD
jgi:hypothetical protein